MEMAAFWRALPGWIRRGAQPRHGPIGLDLASDRLHLMQMEHRAGAVAFRTGCSVPYPVSREATLADRTAFARVVRRALASRPFAGRRVVSCMPPGRMRIFPTEYTQSQGQTEAEALIADLRSRLKDEVDDSVIDYLPIRSDLNGPGQRSAIVAVAKRDDVDAYLSLLEAAGLEPEALDVGPAALARLIGALDTGGERPNVLLVNCGRARSFLTVIWGRRLMLDREVPFGEDRLVDALARNLGIPPADAQDLLCRHGLGTDRDEAARAAAELLRPDFAQLLEDINKTLIYVASRTHGASIDKVLLLGSVARYPGANSFMQSLFSVPVEVVDPLRAFAAPAGADVSDFDPVAGVAVATGLALRGMTVKR